MPAYAGNVSEIVSGMSAADKRSNYTGTFVLRKSDKMMTMHVVHGVDDRGVWESMESLNGEARKIVRHNNEVISIYPERKLVTVSKMGAVGPEPPATVPKAIPEGPTLPALASTTPKASLSSLKLLRTCPCVISPS